MEEILSEKPFIKLVNADCLEYMKTIKDGSIDLVLTDPPYAGAGMNYDCYDDTNIEKVNNLVLDFLKEARRIGKIVIFPSGKYATEKLLFSISPPNGVYVGIKEQEVILVR